MQLDIGSRVRTRDGANAGKIKRIIFDSDNMTVRQFVVQAGVLLPATAENRERLIALREVVDAVYLDNKIRGYILDHLAWMLSDSTGVPPLYARKAGMIQETYGRYTGAFLPDALSGLDSGSGVLERRTAHEQVAQRAQGVALRPFGRRLEQPGGHAVERHHEPVAEVLHLTTARVRDRAAEQPEVLPPQRVRCRLPVGCHVRSSIQRALSAASVQSGKRGSKGSTPSARVTPSAAYSPVSESHWGGASSSG